MPRLSAQNGQQDSIPKMRGHERQGCRSYPYWIDFQSFRSLHDFASLCFFEVCN